MLKYPCHTLRCAAQGVAAGATAGCAFRHPAEEVGQPRRRAVQGSRLLGYKRKTRDGLFQLLAIYALAVLLQIALLYAL
ncbi:MAG: hypothetical protein Hals2KO_19720 [Halioglobus sp.]